MRTSCNKASIKGGPDSEQTLISVQENRTHVALPLVNRDFKTLKKSNGPSPLPPLLSHTYSWTTRVTPWLGFYADAVSEKAVNILSFPGEKPTFKRRALGAGAQTTFTNVESRLGSLPCYAWCAARRRNAHRFLPSRSSSHMTSVLCAVGGNDRAAVHCGDVFHLLDVHRSPPLVSGLIVCTVSEFVSERARWELNVCRRAETLANNRSVCQAFLWRP